MKTTWKDSVESLELGLEDARDIAEEGRLKKALRYLHKELRLYPFDTIPAYLYAKYRDLWTDYRKVYQFDFTFERMSTKELHKRIAEAIKEFERNPKVYNKTFHDKVKQSFSSYLKDDFNARELYNRLSNLEKKYLEDEAFAKGFDDEIRTIFSGYFYGRETISRKIVEEYDKYIRKNFHVTIFSTYWINNNMKRAVEKEVPPEATICDVDVAEGELLEWFYVDPTIPNMTKVLDEALSEEDKQLAVFQSLLKIVHKDGDGKSEIWRVSNWHEVKDQYPELANRYIVRGREYKYQREKMLDDIYKRVLAQVRKFPKAEKDKIVKIADYDRKGSWITVID